MAIKSAIVDRTYPEFSRLYEFENYDKDAFLVTIKAAIDDRASPEFSRH